MPAQSFREMKNALALIIHFFTFFFHRFRTRPRAVAIIMTYTRAKLALAVYTILNRLIDVMKIEWLRGSTCTYITLPIL